MDIIQYPYDPIGTAETNRVKTVRTLPRVRNRAFAPDGGPFYKDSVVLIDVESGDEIPKSDYDTLYLYSEATERVGQAVNGIINVHNEAYYGTIECYTQVVGGPFSSNVSAIQRMLETLEIDNRKIRFDDLIDVPVTMPPAPHLTWVGDLYGAEALVTALEQITAANVNANLDMADLINERYTQVYDLVNSFTGGIEDNGDAINALRDVVNNNHASVTQSIADLEAAIADDRQDLVDIYEELDTRIKAITTQITSMVAQINTNAGNISNLTTSLNALTSRVTALESSLSTLSNQLTTHVNRTDNPHNVTKTQVGLGNIQNYPTGTLTEMRSGTGSRYALSHVVKQFVEEKVAVTTASLNSHIADKNNPHGTTKSHVGLSNVSNFVTGTIAEMRTGTTNRYALGHIVKQFVEEKIAAIDISPDSAGLGNVENYPVGTLAEMRAGTTNRYALSHIVKQFVEEKVAVTTASLNSHVGNKSNPHGTTKSHVGLSNVSNFVTGTLAEMKAGTGSRYALSHIVKQFVEEKVAVTTASLNSHIGNKNNPHGTTKAHVGLSNVSNYSLGTLAEMRAGTTNRYAASAVVRSFVNERIASVTKSSIGLGSVQNYPVATTAQAQAGTSNTTYMTPSAVKAAILAISGSGGDEWELKTADGGKWGILRNKNSLISLQWGQTYAMGINEGCRCKFYRPFVGLPFAVVGSSHSWCGESGEWAQNVEVYAHVVSKSIRSTHFTAASQRIWGGRSDGVVMSWIAVGMVSSATDPTATDVANRATPVTDYSSYVGIPSTVSNLVAPVGGTGGGGGGGGTPPGNGCILPDVEITLADGTVKLAGDIVVGDKLLGTSIVGMKDGSDPNWRQWSSPIDGAKLSSVGVTVTKVTPDTFGSHFIFNDTLKITIKHEILVIRNGVFSWMDAIDIRVGDSLLGTDNKPVKITSIELVDGLTDVVDFDVEDTDTYFAGGYLVHNAEPKQIEP